MTVKDQLKILDRKIRQNKGDYDLYRKNAKIFALSSGKLDKYEYLTGEDPVQKAKFEYCALGQVFNKGLTTDKKSEGLLKRLKNIEDKTDNQLDLIRDQGNRQLDLTGKSYTVRTGNIKFENDEDKKLRDLAKYIKKEIRNILKKNFVHAAYNKIYNFNKETHLGDFANRIYDKELSFKEAKKEQKYFLEEIDELNGRIEPPRGKQPSKKNKENMKEVVNNAREVYEMRNYIISVFEGSEKGIEAKGRLKVDLSWLRYPEYFKKLRKDYEEDPDLSHSFDNNKKTIDAVADAADNDVKTGLEDIKIIVPLKNVSNFMFSLDFLLTNSETELILKWTEDCVLTENQQEHNYHQVLVLMLFLQLIDQII